MDQANRYVELAQQELATAGTLSTRLSADVVAANASLAAAMLEGAGALQLGQQLQLQLTNAVAECGRTDLLVTQLERQLAEAEEARDGVRLEVTSAVLESARLAVERDTEIQRLQLELASHRLTSAQQVGWQRSRASSRRFVWRFYIFYKVFLLGSKTANSIGFLDKNACLTPKYTNF